MPELKGGLVLKKCDAERSRKIDLIFLSIGGNDIGFARLVANAVLSDTSHAAQLGGWFGQVYGFAEAGSLARRARRRVKSVNRAMHYILHVPWSEFDRIVLSATRRWPCSATASRSAPTATPAWTCCRISR